MSAARYTLAGGAAVESLIAGTVAAVADGLASAVRPGDVRSAVLIGGYGKGEGAVEIDAAGMERPHNDLDIVVIAEREDPALRRDLERVVAERLRPAAASAGLDLEVSVTTVARLLRDDCRIIWYEMRNGHRTLLGDADFVAGLTRFPVERLLLDDVRDLVLNRCALLAILRLLGRACPADPRVAPVGLRYWWKAVLATGDALLAYHGGYHWSTIERGRRIAAAAWIPGPLRDLYARALAWRARIPSEVSAASLDALASEALPAVRDGVLLSESLRLGRPGLTWDGWPALALGHAWRSWPQGLRPMLRRVRDVLRAPPAPSTWSLAERLGARAAGARGRLALALPAVCLSVGSLERTARESLRCPEGPLEEAFLRAWSVVSEPELPAFLGRFGVSLAEVPAAGTAA